MPGEYSIANIKKRADFKQILIVVFVISERIFANNILAPRSMIYTEKTARAGGLIFGFQPSFTFLRVAL